MDLKESDTILYFLQHFIKIWQASGTWIARACQKRKPRVSGRIICLDNDIYSCWKVSLKNYEIGKLRSPTTWWTLNHRPWGPITGFIILNYCFGITGFIVLNYSILKDDWISMLLIYKYLEKPDMMSYLLDIPCVGLWWWKLDFSYLWLFYSSFIYPTIDSISKRTYLLYF